MDLKALKDIALANVLTKDTEYFYRYTCRWFSKTFNTPLMEVYELPPDEVFMAFFEEGYEKLEASEEGEDVIFTDALRAVDPDFDEKEEEAINDFVAMIEAEEKAKREKKEKEKAKKGQQEQESFKHSGDEASKGPVIKTYEDTESPLEADGDGLEGLESIAKSLSEDDKA